MAHKASCDFAYRTAAAALEQAGLAAADIDVLRGSTRFFLRGRGLLADRGKTPPRSRGDFGTSARLILHFILF